MLAMGNIYFHSAFILTKYFYCLNSDNLRKRNLSNGRFSVTVTTQFTMCFIKFVEGKRVAHKIKIEPAALNITKKTQ